MKAAKIINIAHNFSRFPAGRYKSDGPFSGELFRDDFLVPVLKSGTPVSLELDGVRGYGSSFLEEVFGGLVRLGYSSQELTRLISLRCSDPSIVDEINDYIHNGVEDHGNARG